MPYADPEVAKVKARERYERDRDQVIEQATAWAKANPERRREIARESARRRYPENYERNKEAIKANSRRQAIAHPERQRASNRKYQQKPEVKARRVERQQERRARKLGQFVEHVDRQVVWERDEGVCGICGTAADRADWHLDHVIPLVAGGEHSYANVQVSHPACNCSKGGRTPSQTF